MSTVTAEHNHHHEHHFDGSKMFLVFGYIL